MAATLVTPIKKPAIAIVCAGEDAGFYWGLVGVVAAAVKRLERCVPVLVVCDRPFNDARATAVVDEIKVVRTPYQDGRRASRWLKVHLRMILEGDFLYLDTDAVPVRPFVELACSSRDVAAVPDFTGLKPAGAFPDWARPMFAAMGWSIPAGQYMNSGVVYWPDTPEAYRLAGEWLRAWDQTVAYGECRDQPAFNRAIAVTNTRILKLDRSLNTMVDVAPDEISEARILHFFVSATAGEDTILARLNEQLSNHEALDWAAVEAAVAAGTVWPRLSASAAHARVALRTINATWRSLDDSRLDDAMWLSARAWKLTPWSPGSYAMLARVGVALARQALSRRRRHLG